MKALDWLWQTPRDLELWLLVGYVAVVLIGARIIEALAKAHYSRADRLAKQGFEYSEPRDHYQCLGGATLRLDKVHEPERMAIYRAPVEHCGGCHLKPACAPLEESRTVYRSLASWAETDVGRFQQYVSLLMFAAAGVLSLAGIYRWHRHAGAGYLILAFAGSLACLVLQSSRMKFALRARTSAAEPASGEAFRPNTATSRDAADWPEMRRS